MQRVKKHKNPKIDAVCAYCEYSKLHTENGEEIFSCPYKKKIDPEGHCFRFRYDVLKRTPGAKLPHDVLDPEALAF